MTIDDLYCFADTENISVMDFSLNSREALSTMDADGNCFVAIDPEKIRSSADRKTKLAHEIGHCDTGAFYNVYSPFDVRRRYENRADKWAIKKLIPEDELEKAVAKGYTETWELAEYFDVSEDLIRKAVSWYRFGSLIAI